MTKPPRVPVEYPDDPEHTVEGGHPYMRVTELRKERKALVAYEKDDEGGLKRTLNRGPSKRSR